MADVAQVLAYDRLHMYKRARRAFSCRVFSLAAIFVLMAAAQWIPLLLFDVLRDGLNQHFYISYIVFFCALLTVTVFILFERVRFIVPLNWILTIFIVECVIWGLARAVVESQIDDIGYSFAAVLLVVVLMLFIGGCIRHDLTLDVVLLFLGSLILFLCAIVFVVLDIVANIPYVAYFYVTIVIIMVLVFLMYHSQTILGGRYAEIRIADYLLAALMVFLDFLVLFVLTFYLTSRIHMKT